jgi:hypothetical protein
VTEMQNEELILAMISKGRFDWLEMNDKPFKLLEIDGLGVFDGPALKLELEKHKGRLKALDLERQAGDLEQERSSEQRYRGTAPLFHETPMLWRISEVISISSKLFRSKREVFEVAFPTYGEKARERILLFIGTGRSSERAPWGGSRFTTAKTLYWLGFVCFKLLSPIDQLEAAKYKQAPRGGLIRRTWALRQKENEEHLGVLACFLALGDQNLRRALDDHLGEVAKLATLFTLRLVGDVAAVVEQSLRSEPAGRITAQVHDLEVSEWIFNVYNRHLGEQHDSPALLMKVFQRKYSSILEDLQRGISPGTGGDRPRMLSRIEEVLPYLTNPNVYNNGPELPPARIFKDADLVCELERRGFRVLPPAETKSNGE